MSVLKINEIDGGVTFGVKVVPGSSRTSIAGTLDGALKVKISAAPEKGKANQSLIAFLAKTLGVNKRSISIESGQTNPHKIISVKGVSADIILEKLEIRNSKL
ncbi:MAG: YggU family protein [Planctomycetes bacterium]|nr:YggU family protein [Planctomycetota bacterium]